MELVPFASIGRIRDEVDGDKLDGSRRSDTLEAHKAVPCLWQSNCPTFQPMLQARLLSFEEIPTFLNTYWRGCSERDESQSVQSKPACPESMARYSSFFTRGHPVSNNISPHRISPDLRLAAVRKQGFAGAGSLNTSHGRLPYAHVRLRAQENGRERKDVKFRDHAESRMR